jgi:hypothetical protein
MGAHLITAHPRPFATDLQNHKQVRADLIRSFTTAQQEFLLKHKWTYRKEKNSINVKITFGYNFSGKEDMIFRLLFSNYKLFNYCRKTVDFSI